jgi:5'(3')-deoxyribonucleotidase
MRIAIDFDETLFGTLEKVLEIYNKTHEAQVSMYDITTYNLYECLDHAVADELIGLFVEKSVYNNLQPYKGSVKAVKSLVEQGHEVYVATSSDIRNMEWKERLLQRYFPFIPKENLIRIHNKKLLNVDILVEDKLDNLTQTFADRVCFDQPWNRDDSADFAYSIYRVRHWGEVVNIINNIERKNEEYG